MLDNREENLNLFNQLLNETTKSIKKVPNDYHTRINKLITNCIKEIENGDYVYKAHYKNSNNVIVELDISRHALERFKIRLNRVYNCNIQHLSNVKLEQLMCLMVNSSVKENLNKCKTLSNRKKKYFLNNGNHFSIYLKYGCFRFVVSEKKIITVELRGYYFNKN